jgi:hypothetical protein
MTVAKVKPYNRQTIPAIDFELITQGLQDFFTGVPN